MCMKQAICIFLISAAFCGTAAAQVCGGGQKTISVFVRNDLTALRLRYRLYSVGSEKYKGDYEKTADYLSENLIGDGKQHTGRCWFIKSITVDPERAARELAGYDAKQFRTIDASDPHYKPELAGPIEFGRIKFDTRETNDDPYLLEITADNYEPVYLLEAHLGGCSRRENVLLTRMR